MDRIRCFELRDVGSIPAGPATKIMITRIMCVGQGRVYEAACSLSFDFNLYPKIDSTMIVSVYTADQLKHYWEKFNIDYSKLTFLHDSEIDLPKHWKNHHWYFQQGIKLELLDTLDSDQFVIQDCDLVCLHPFALFNGSLPCFRVEELWNPYQTVYEEAVTELTGLSRVEPYSFVTEIMPYNKSDWLGCKQLIESRFNKDWKTAISNLRPFDETKWLSEYELLGIYKTNLDNKWNINIDNHPVINDWKDFEQANWAIVPTLKFKAKPLKFMRESQAQYIIDFFQNPRSSMDRTNSS